MGPLVKTFTNALAQCGLDLVRDNALHQAAPSPAIITFSKHLERTGVVYLVKKAPTSAGQRR